MSPVWKGSLTFDLEQGRRLEVDWLSGAVCRRGEAAGITTPFHRVALGRLEAARCGRRPRLTCRRGLAAVKQKPWTVAEDVWRRISAAPPAVGVEM
jgi:hypothetical protein